MKFGNIVFGLINHFYVVSQSPPLAMAIAQQLKEGSFKEETNSIEFNVIEVASAIGWDSGVVKRHLKELEWTIGKTIHAIKNLKKASLHAKYLYAYSNR